ncbi:unnamed protein product [Musa textilis]
MVFTGRCLRRRGDRGSNFVTFYFAFALSARGFLLLVATKNLVYRSVFCYKDCVALRIAENGSMLFCRPREMHLSRKVRTSATFLSLANGSAVASTMPFSWHFILRLQATPTWFEREEKS